MPPVLCIVGRSNTGKTTLLEKLIPELRGRGHRITTVKHRASGFDLDQPGKDSWRHGRAGSDRVILSSPQQLALIEGLEHDLTLAELAQFVRADSDLVLIEGYKHGKAPKIEVHRKGSGELVSRLEELLAVVTDERLELDDRVPQYSADDTAVLADLIEQKVLARREAERVHVFADGKPLPLNPFLKGLFYKVVSDMVLSLKGVGSPRGITVSIERD